MEVNKWRRTGNPETSLPHDDAPLRNLIPQGDLPVFFENQCDPEANYMAAFTARDPSDRAGFQAFWDRILTEPKIVIRTILFQGEVASSILRYKHGRRRECE